MGRKRKEPLDINEGQICPTCGKEPNTGKPHRIKLEAILRPREQTEWLFRCIIGSIVPM